MKLDLADAVKSSARVRTVIAALSDHCRRCALNRSTPGWPLIWETKELSGGSRFDEVASEGSEESEFGENFGVVWDSE